jgi:hypothetical protein
MRIEKGRIGPESGVRFPDHPMRIDEGRIGPESGVRFPDHPMRIEEGRAPQPVSIVARSSKKAP